MNERIEKLAKQTGYIWHTSGDPQIYEFTPEKLEKFAELIVRECANIALEQKKRVEDQEVFNPQDEQWNRARIQQSQHIVDKIKQHFGVGE